MKTKLAPTLLVGLGLLMFTQATTAQQSDFKLIVNASNPVPSLTRDQVEKVFLKRTSRWEDGREVTPVDQAATSETAQRFARTIHRRTALAIRSHWQTQIFSGRGVPPVEFKTDQAVIEYVTANPGAIGYVAADADIGPECKVVTLLVS